MSKNKGFTLIELLVVISIIAILSTIGLAYYGNFLRSSRDTRRQSDLKVIQSALQEYNSDQIFYPFSEGSNSLQTTSSDIALDSSLGNPSPPSSSKTYLTTMPKDPISTNLPYCYVASSANCNNTTQKCTSYTLYAKLENPSAGSGSYSCRTTSGYNFRVLPP